MLASSDCRHRGAGTLVMNKLFCLAIATATLMFWRWRPAQSRSSEEVFHHLIHCDPKALHHLQELGAWELEQRLHALGIGLDLHLGEGRLWKSEQADAGEVLIEPDQVPSQALFVVNGQVAVRSPGQGDPVMLLGSGSVIGADACCAGHAFGHTSWPNPSLISSGFLVRI